MSPRFFLTTLLPASGALLFLANPVPAAAFTFICPGGPGPGEVQVGVQQGPGFNGVPVCAADPNAAYNDDSGGGDGGSGGPAADPMARRLDAAIEMEKEALLAQIEAMRKGGDARPQGATAGSWEYFQDAPDAKPGELCTAFFSRDGGYVAVTSPARDSPNAYLTFWGANVPRPTEVKRVQVTLAQSGGNPPQTVTALGRVGCVPPGPSVSGDAYPIDW